MTYVRTIVAVFVSVQLGVFVPLFPVLAQAQQVSSTTPSQEQAVQIDEVVSSPEPEIAEEQPADTDETEVIIPTVEEEELEITDETSSSTPTQEINASTTTPTEETDVREDIDTSTTLDPVVIENNDDEVTSSQRIGYVRMMRDLRSSRLSDTVSAPEVLDQFTSFLKSEKDRVSELPISRSNRNAYLQRLEGQFKAVDTSEKSRFENVWTKMKEFFGIEEPPLRFDEETEADIPNVQRLEEPAEFAFQPDDVEVTGLHAVEVPGSQDIDEAIKTFLTIKEANADNTYFPVLEDLSGDSSEIVFTPSMRSLARELHNNPVEIYNFVRQRITYEPYFGAKKGSVGCLEEMRCNDVDAASLTLALMRAAGIPGHYKKSIMVVSIDQLQEMFGLDHTTEAKRTVYGIFGWNDIPVYSISNNPSLGNVLDEADFTDETHFALEWVFPEIYYEYDERGANIDNFVDLSVASSTAALQEFFQETYKKQWIAMDVLFKDYTRIENEIVSDTASFNTENFWYSFYQYQGELSPMFKYVADLQNATGKDITSDEFHSYREPSDKSFDILPPRLPYVLGEGVDGYGNEILPETWSVLPDARKQSVTFQLKKQDTGEVVFETSLFGSDLRNKEFNLYYEGMTEDDTAIIDSYGGIHATPAELVDIHPTLLTDDAEYVGDVPVSIGEGLVMRFDYYVNGELEHSDEKFSVAGNQEGIFMTLSRVQADPELTDNSLILLKGNTAIARQFLLRGQESSDLLAKTLDHSYNVNFARAVVTQNRVLSTVNGSPTTFDFKGFTIDAGTYINNWSNTGNYKTHRKDFRLLWGLESSYQEGQIFKDITGLSSISTVQGLQYAYAHPESYTMHIITSANEAVIDTLALSANTKANMHADVQAGNTILTADKFVQKGVWNGILYTSIEPEGTGTYAIGEQSQSNGGATTDPLVASFEDANGEEITIWNLAFVKGPITYRFSYQDRPYSVNGLVCSIEKTIYDEVVNSPNWSIFFGHPCAKEEKDFSTVKHTYIVASYATKFFSPNKYNYWTTYANTQAVIRAAVGSSFKNEKFKFNITAGTYSYYDGSTYYYEPVGGTVGGRAHKVSGAILSKLEDPGYIQSICPPDDLSCLKKGWIVSRIGFPVKDQAGAAKSLSGTSGYYQEFVGGDVYVETDWFNEVFYVPEQIRKTYSNYENSINGKYGTGGRFGFPSHDPVYIGAVLHQDFENGYRISAIGNYLDNNYQISIQQDYSQGEFRDLMIDGFADAFREMGFVDFAVNFGEGVILNEIIQSIVKKVGAKVGAKVAVRYIPVIGWTIAGLNTAQYVNANLPLASACNKDPYTLVEGVKPAYYCGKLAGNGALTVLGFVTDSVAGHLNKLYVKSNPARVGKSKILLAAGKQYTNEFYTKLSADNPNLRDEVNLLMNSLDQKNIDRVSSDKPMMQRLFTDARYLNFQKISDNVYTWRHIFEGSGGGGWHYFHTGKNIAGNEIVTIKVGTKGNGPYKATVKVGGKLKTEDSSFFPDEWSEKQVMDAINQAFQNKKFDNDVPPTTFSKSYVATVNGIKILMNISNTNGRIISAYPKL